nr:MAG: DNA pilot protein [Microviridae sp.]
MSAADFMGAGGSILSSVAGGLFGLMGTQDSNAANAQQAQIQRDWETNMFQTRYQNTVNDLRSAGLNPMLAFEGSGPSTPSGAMSPAMQNPMAAAVSSGSQAGEAISALQTASKNRDEIQSRIDLNKAESLKTAAETTTELNRPENVQADTNLKYGQHGLANASAFAQTAQGNLHQTIMEQQPTVSNLLKSETIKNISSASNLDTMTRNESLHTPELYNRANAENSWWKRNISPYLHDFSSAADTAQSGAQFGANLKYLKGGN